MLSKEELKTLDSIARGITHYQLLKLSVAASDKDISEAFHREALMLHPDRYQPTRDPEAIQLAKNVYSKLVDAYRTLSNRERREDYDQGLQAANALKGGTSKPSISKAMIARLQGEPPTNPGAKIAGQPPNSNSTSSFGDENSITAVRQKPVGAATSAGIKFYKMAQIAYNSRDLQAAKMNIQIALNTDPKNPEFLQFAERLESELGRKK